jgi:hypothetical protein
VIAAETSDVPGGNFLDMEEGIAGQYHLKPGLTEGLGGKFGVLRQHQVRCLGMSEVGQCAHMKSFSLFCRRMYVGMGGLNEHRCSRINLTGGIDVYLKQFLAGDMSEKCFFLREFSPKLIVRISLAVRRAFSFNL